MHGDPNFSKFFLYLNLFVFSMLMLVLGENLLVTFLGWEGVGVCSYFLISFWHTRDSAAVAGKKAFVTNRIGDFGVMTAMFLAFSTIGSVSYSSINEAAHSGVLAPATATAIGLLLFVGACGKSAQLPLYLWLPDAMEGPTPVSALIHAATMVTSGVFLMTRMSPVLHASYEWAPMVIACVGAATALFAATIAVAQNDIKKVLAYSTVSQLGYMFRARHASHGCIAQAHAGYCDHVHHRLVGNCWRSSVRRFLVEGRNFALCICKQSRPLRRWFDYCVTHRVLHDTSSDHGVLR
jgi:NADH-quinone oxidoreductase subunit L